jgi:DNA-directed RNA polymerase subunit RPC12/RpoP
VCDLFGISNTGGISYRCTTTQLAAKVYRSTRYPTNFPLVKVTSSLILRIENLTTHSHSHWFSHSNLQLPLEYHFKFALTPPTPHAYHTHTQTIWDLFSLSLLLSHSLTLNLSSTLRFSRLNSLAPPHHSSTYTLTLTLTLAPLTFFQSRPQTRHNLGTDSQLSNNSSHTQIHYLALTLTLHNITSTTISLAHGYSLAGTYCRSKRLIKSRSRTSFSKLRQAIAGC